ncbi:MAG: hypothetical protein ACRC7O_14610 [Fimbriiglobus sp.]
MDRSLSPSLTAFAGLQRIARKCYPDIALPFRERFLELGLPVVGFDSEGAVKDDPERPGEGSAVPGADAGWWLDRAIRAVPEVKWALGVVGVAAAVSIVLSLRFFTPWVAVVGTLAMFVFMVMLVVFAGLIRLQDSAKRGPALVLMWAFVLVPVGWGLLITSCVFFNVPKPPQDLFTIFPTPSVVAPEGQTGTGK